MMRSCCVVAVCAVLAGSAAGAQVDSPASRLEAASALTSLDGVDQKPWHLKLDVTVIEQTKIPNEGTIEVWHAGADERTVYTFGNATSTTLKHDGKTYYSPRTAPVPFEASEVLRMIVHPGPRQAELVGAVPELRKQKFGKSEFDCVMLSQSMKGSAKVPLGLYPTYCLSDGEIRITFGYVGEAVTLARMGTFLGHHVAVEEEIRQGQEEVATAKIVTLATYTPVKDEFVPAEDMVAATATTRIAGGVIAGSRVSFVQPVYPESAKRDHREGTVVLHAIIDRYGNVGSLRPVSASDPDFVISAIAAVRQWVYRPYLLNGVPTEVDTTITVNFRLNPT